MHWSIKLQNKVLDLQEENRKLSEELKLVKEEREHFKSLAEVEFYLKIHLSLCCIMYFQFRISEKRRDAV